MKDKTFHDFDVDDGDIIKEHICSLIDYPNIWKTDDVFIVRGGLNQEEILKLLFDLKTDVLCLVNGKCFDAKQIDDIFKELNIVNLYNANSMAEIPMIFLSNKGKFIIKLKDNVAISVFMKVENRYGVLHIKKYSPDEEEILFDEESDDDIYIHEFKPKFTSISDVNLALKGKKINLDKTMGRVNMPDFWEGPTVEVGSCGIYIPTVYASEGDSGSKEIYEYEIDDDDFVTVGVFSGLGDYDLRLSPQYYTGDEAGDYGIEVFDNGTFLFSENRGGICGGIREIRDLSEPLNAFVIEILMNTLVFEDPSDEIVMCCPDCGNVYVNGEESCPECGTKLITEFEMHMLEYKGLL